MQVTCYQPEVDRALARYVKGNQDAEDLAHECYIDLLRAQNKLAELKAEGNDRKYAYVVARNRILKIVQRAARPVFMPPVPKVNLELREAIANLPHGQWAVIWLRYFYGFSDADIGVVMHQSPEWVRLRKTGALKRLRRELRNEGMAVVPVSNIRIPARHDHPPERRTVEEVRRAA